MHVGQALFLQILNVAHGAAEERGYVLVRPKRALVLVLRRLLRLHVERRSRQPERGVFGTKSDACVVFAGMRFPPFAPSRSPSNLTAESDRARKH